MLIFLYGGTCNIYHEKFILGWSPVGLGPVSADEINSYLTKCKKIMWIGPVRFSSSNQDSVGTSTLVLTLDRLAKRDCEVTVVGETACNTIMQESVCPSVYQKIENATVVWEFLKGRKLPGLMALDRAYSSEVDWHSVYSDPNRPLVVDIGSGNGLFLFEMAIRRKDMNFLGLEINEKLVRRCLSSIVQSGIKNSYFIATNATSTFRSIVSSYPGELILVTILCPNPDFSNPAHRWRMLQRSLVEGIVDLLTPDGKVYLQSDIEEVAQRMKELFLKYGKDKLIVMPGTDNEKVGGWLEENPFGVYSDWEQHVLDRGDEMYRLILSRSMNLGSAKNN